MEWPWCYNALVLFLALLLVSFCVGLLILKQILKSRKNLQGRQKQTIGIFHPYCNAGGGGERVLWCIVRSLQKSYPETSITVYTGDHVAPEELISNASKRFNVEIDDRVQFRYLRRRAWVEASRYPVFTLLGQSLGSMWLGLEALFLYVPDIYIDTMGYAFTFPLFRYLGGCKIACYVHYPTISTDMLLKVAKNLPSYNNSGAIARSARLSTIKLLYYKLFAKLYCWVGRCSDIVLVNSSWTENHINAIWNIPLKTHRVYPPCDVSEFLKISPIPDSEKKVKTIVSVAQFRPEKDHALMLMSFFGMMQVIPDELKSKVKLIFVGSVRDENDRKRVKDYKDLAKHLSVEDYVEFKVNVSFTELKEELRQATVGLHAMWNEHFGISIVECMAAGLVMVAHKSGGPLMDIISESGTIRNGFLAEYEDEYATAILRILNMSDKERESIREAARSSVHRFSDSAFDQEFRRTISTILDA